MRKDQAVRKFLITGLGTGYMPFAPGTWGSLGVTIIYVALAMLGVRAPIIWGVMAGIAVLATWGCLAWGEYAEGVFGKKDPGQVTLDEWAGQAVAYLFVPFVAGWSGVLTPALIGLMLFRFMDIAKPSPACRLQSLKGGLGIVVDDLIAGVYANIAAQVMLRWVLQVA